MSAVNYHYWDFPSYFTGRINPPLVFKLIRDVKQLLILSADSSSVEDVFIFGEFLRTVTAWKCAIQLCSLRTNWFHIAPIRRSFYHSAGNQHDIPPFFLIAFLICADFSTESDSCDLRSFSDRFRGHAAV